MVTAVSEHNLSVAEGSESAVVRLEGRASVTLQRQKVYEDGGPVLRRTVTLRCTDPDMLDPLRLSPYRRWIARLSDWTGRTMTLGTLDYPATLTTDGSDTEDTLTLTDTQIV